MDECGHHLVIRSSSHDGTSLPRVARPMSNPPGAIRTFTSSSSGPERPRTPPGATIQEPPTAGVGVTPFQGPRHPRYVSLASRLATYQAWPPGLHQKPQQLAGAGFFYEGTSDQVKCFSCDGGLGSWEEEDSPEEQHRKWFPHCTFVTITLASPPPATGARPPVVISKDTPEKAMRTTDQGLEESTTLDEIAEGQEEIHKQIQQMRDERSCKICFEHEASVVFLPCGHLSSCTTCATALSSCPVCRAQIQGLVRAFMA